MSVRKRSSYSISFKLRAVEVAERVSKESGWCMEQSIHAHTNKNMHTWLKYLLLLIIASDKIIF